MMTTEVEMEIIIITITLITMQTTQGEITLIMTTTEVTKIMEIMEVMIEGEETDMETIIIIIIKMGQIMDMGVIWEEE